MLRILVVALATVSPLVAQSPRAPEAFSFDPQGSSFTPAPPVWWGLAASPDGKSAVTAHAFEKRGGWRAWDLVANSLVADVPEPGGTRFVRYSPDGLLVVTANFDGHVRVYDAQTRKLLVVGNQQSGGHVEGVNAVAFDRTGQFVVSAGLDRTARLWDVRDAVARARKANDAQPVAMTPRVVFEGMAQTCYSAAISPDAKQLITSGPEGVLLLWSVPDLADGKTIRVDMPTREIVRHRSTVEVVAFSADGQRFASGSWDNTARLFDATGKEIAVLRGHSRGIMAIAFSPDSKTLATVSGDHTSNAAGEVRLWNANDGTERGQVGAEPDMVLGVDWLDHARLVTCGRDRALRVWDIATRQTLATLRSPADQSGVGKAVNVIAYSPDGATVAIAAEESIQLWSVAERRPLHEWLAHKDAISGLVWSADGARLYSAGRDKQFIVWDVATRKALQTISQPTPIYSLALSPDGATIAVGGFDTVVRLLSSKSGEVQAQFAGHTASVRSLAFSPDGKRLASGGADHAVRVWDIGKKEPPLELVGHARAVRAVRFVANDLLLTAGEDRFVRQWSIPDGELKQSYGPTADAVLSMEVSPGRSFLIAGLANGWGLLLDPRTMSPRGALRGLTGEISAVAIAPDGRQVIAGGQDRDVRSWSPIARPAIAGIDFASGGPANRSVAISPTPTTIAIGGEDGTIRLLDSVTGAIKKKWPAHEGAVEHLAYSPDGEFLASGGVDGVAKVWRADGTIAHTTRKLSEPARLVAVSKGGRFLAVATTSLEVEVFELGAKSDRTVKSDGAPVSLQFLNDDSLLLAGGAKAYLWDVPGKRVLTNIDGSQFARITSASTTLDGRLAVLTGEPAVGTVTPETQGYSRVLVVSYYHSTPVSTRMSDTGVGAVQATVAGDGRIVAIVNGDGMVRMWDWPETKLMRSLQAHANAIPQLAIANAGEFAITVGADGAIRRWPAARGESPLFAARIVEANKQTWFARQSPDGKFLVTGGDDGILRVRSAVPGTFRELTGEHQAVYSVAYSPDGTLLATGHNDGAITIWDTKTNTRLRTIDRHQFRIWSLAFTPDGSRLVSGGGNWDDTNQGELRIWDTTSWKTIHEVPAHDDLVLALAISPDGKTILTGSRDNSIRSWDIVTGKETAKKGVTNTPRSIAFLPSGQQFYSCGADHRLRWWDAKTMTEVDSAEIPDGEVERLVVSPDEKRLILAVKYRARGNPFALASWDVEKNRLIKVSEQSHRSQINALAFAPDGKSVASGGGRYTSVPRYLPGPTGPWGVETSVTRDGKMVTQSVPVCELKIWDVERLVPTVELNGHKYLTEAIAFAPGGGGLVTAGGIPNVNGEVRSWDVAGLMPIEAPVGAAMSCGRYSPDGALFAVGTQTGQLKLFKSNAGKLELVRTMAAHRGIVRALEWTRDGGRLVTSGEDGLVKVWSPGADEPVRTIVAHDRPVYGVAISPDGKTIASAAGDYRARKPGEVRLWDIESGTELARLPDTDRQAVWNVAFLGNDRLVTAQEGEIGVKIWDTTTKKLIRGLNVPETVRGLAVSADGKWIAATGGREGMVKIWEVGTWRESFEVTAHPGKVSFGVDFGVDGQTILSAGRDAAIVWKLPGGTWKAPPFEPPPPPRTTRPSRGR